MITAGRLRDRISIQRKTTSQTPDGGSETVWDTIHDTYADVEEVRPSVDVIAQQQNIQIMIRVRIRYNPELSIKNGDRIEWRGFILVAMAPKVDPLRRWIEFVAHSEIEETER